MTPEQVEAFKTFQFWKNDDWNTHFKSFEFRPTIDQLPRIQKKWYKRYIDAEFDIDADLSTYKIPEKNETEPEPQQQHQNCSGNNATTGPGPRTRDYSSDKAYMLEGFCKCLFVILTFLALPIPYSKWLTLAVGMGSCILGMVRQIGSVLMSKEYFLKALGNDFGISMFYIIIIISIPQLTSFLWLPVNIQFILGVAEFLPRSQIGFLQKEFVQKYCRALTLNRTDIKRSRHYVEFFMIFYFVIMACVGFHSVIIVLIYVHYVKFKYKLNYETQVVINGIKNWLNGKANSVGSAAVILNKIINGFFWIISF